MSKRTTRSIDIESAADGHDSHHEVLRLKLELADMREELRRVKAVNAEQRCGGADPFRPRDVSRMLAGKTPGRHGPARFLEGGNLRDDPPGCGPCAPCFAQYHFWHKGASDRAEVTKVDTCAPIRAARVTCRALHP